jgi:hypothetical protein
MPLHCITIYNLPVNFDLQELVVPVSKRNPSPRARYRDESEGDLQVWRSLATRETEINILTIAPS